MNKNNQDFYQAYEERLAFLIEQESNGEIPDDMCARLAHMGANKKKYHDSKGISKSIDSYVTSLIEAYFE